MIHKLMQKLTIEKTKDGQLIYNIKYYYRKYGTFKGLIGFLKVVM